MNLHNIERIKRFSGGSGLQQRKQITLNAVIVVPTYCGQGHRRIVEQDMFNIFQQNLFSFILQFVF